MVLGETGGMQEDDARTMIWVLGMMAFWCIGENYAAAPLLVEIARDLHLSISEAALSVSAYMLPFGFFTFLFGPLADRFGKAKVINLAAFGSAIFCALAAGAFNLVSLSVFRAVNGAFAAAILPVTMSLVGDRFGHAPNKFQTRFGKNLWHHVPRRGSGYGHWRGAGVFRLLAARRILFYGMAEFVTVLIMLKILEKQPGTLPA